MYPINPQGAAVDGVTGFSSVADTAGDIDLAIVAVPARAVPGVVEECGRKRVHGLVVISAGLDEELVDGLPIERTVVDRALRFGMRVIGPESLGVINTAPDSPLFATFANVDGPGGPHPEESVGSVGFLTQSGTLGMAALEHASRVGIGISTFVDIGSRPDVSGNDLLQFWWDDPRTSVVLLYLETFGNPRKFTRIAREMARTKPIVAVKSGRTLAAEPEDPSGGLAAVWPPDATADALLAQSGVIRVDTPPELFEVARVLLHQPIPRGRTGRCRLQFDRCDHPVGRRMRTGGTRGRAGGDDDVGRRTGRTTRPQSRAALADDDVDSILLVYAPPVRERRDEIVAAVGASVHEHADAGGSPKPVLATFLGGGHGANGVVRLRHLAVVRVPRRCRPRAGPHRTARLVVVATRRQAVRAGSRGDRASGRGGRVAARVPPPGPLARP